MRRLTESQENHVRWALDGIQGSGWDDAGVLAWDADISLEEAGKISPYVMRVEVVKGVLVVPGDATREFREWLAEDMEYRLMVQLEQMEDGAYEDGLLAGKSYSGAAGGAKSMTASALRAWETVKEHISGLAG